MWLRCILVSSVIVFILGISTNGWTSDRYCHAYINSIDPDTLYVVNCTAGTNCTHRVVYSTAGAVLEQDDKTTSYLRHGRKYHFIYKVSPPVAQNSLVVIHIKRLDNPARDSSSPVRVLMRRKSINFGCHGFYKHVRIPSWPPKNISDERLPSVAYENYDQFHRLGYTSGDEDYLLREKFHVRYDNGSGCVSTLDTARRWQFLFEDRTNVFGRIAAFFARLGIYTPTANAAALDQIKKFEKLKVLVANYASLKGPDGKVTPACFGFSVYTGGTKTVRLDISVSDIESVAPFFPFDAAKAWSFDVQ
jgi:hypothetical protein